MDDLSNFAIWKARILVVMEAYGLKEHAKKVLATSTDAKLLAEHNEAVVHARHFIMDGIKHHVLPHIAEKMTAHEMWVALTTLY